MSVRVLGVGSPAADDQAGWLVIDALLALGIGSNVVLEKLDRPGASLVEWIDGASHVVIVDAMQGGGMPGEIRHFTQDPWTRYRGGLSSHGLGVLDALALAQAMGELPALLEVYGIEIGSADPLGEPGQPVREAALRLATDLRARLATEPRDPRAAA